MRGRRTDPTVLSSADLARARERLEKAGVRQTDPLRAALFRNAVQAIDSALAAILAINRYDEQQEGR